MTMGLLNNNYTILFEFKYYLLKINIFMKKTSSIEEGKKPPDAIQYEILEHAIILQPLTCLEFSRCP
jgi:hypothetical protein